MPYLIDTNVAIHAFDGHEAVLRKFLQHNGAIFLSVLGYAELLRGLHRRPSHTSVRQTQLQLLLQQIPIWAFDVAATETYGRIIAQLGWVKGRDYDRMIAAHAISTASILVTSNEADFRDIPGLQIENWAVAGR